MMKWNGREVIWAPNPGPQTVFLATPVREALYGGAAGGGKSDAILMGPMRWADHPLNRAIIFRRTRPQLQEVIDRTLVLYPQIAPGAKWNERESRWKLPAGGYIQMGYAEHEDDILAFKTFEYNYIGFDELTSFTERMYTFMFSRNRTKSADLPPMVRAGTNPGDIGHDWVFNRFIAKRMPYQIYEENETLDVGGKLFKTSFTRQFIPAKVTDNPKLPNVEDYVAGLLQMGEEGQQYLHGVWTRIGGFMFKRMPEEVEARLDRRSGYHVIMAIDYGLSDPTCVLWLVVYDGNITRIDVAGELYINEVSVNKVAELIKIYEQETLRLVPSQRVADPKLFARDPTSMQSVASMLGDAGIVVDKANNDRIAGWAQIQRFIYRNQLRLWENRAPNLERTLPNLLRHPTKPNDIKDRQEDHPADALRYGLMAVYDKLGTAAGPATTATSGFQRPAEYQIDQEYDQLVADLANQGGRRDEFDFLEG